MAAPSAAIIISHYNDVVRLSRCLAALLPQIISNTELIVIDNGSTQSLAPVRAAHPALRIVLESQEGAANARNRGVSETTAPLLFFLDCDCIPASDWLATALQVAGQADLVGGQITVFDEVPSPIGTTKGRQARTQARTGARTQARTGARTQARTGAQAFEAVFAFDNQAYVETKGFSVTANLLTRRDVFDAVGPFVAGLSEDLDWCHRARAKGYRLAYAPDLRVAHPSRGDWSALVHKWQRLTREGFAVNGVTPVARAKWAIRALLMPFSILAHAPRILRSPRLHGARDRLAALGTLARIRLQRAIWMLRQAAGGTI